MNEINEQLKGISELVTRIDAKVLEITTKLYAYTISLHTLTSYLSDTHTVFCFKFRFLLQISKNKSEV